MKPLPGSPALALAAALLLLPMALASSAQPATGGLAGRVLNPRSGEFVPGARVTVEGTLLETFTDADGYYQLANVPSGPAKVRVFFTGLLPRTDEVAVTAGQLTRHDGNLLTFETRRDVPAEDAEIHGPTTPPHAQFRQRLDHGSLWMSGLKGTM